MPNPSSSKKIDPTIVVALITLAGVVIAAILASPLLIAWIQRTPTPTIEPTEKPIAASTPAPSTEIPSPLPATSTSTPGALVIYADADKSWPIARIFADKCTAFEGGIPCPTPTPVNEERLDLSSCPGVRAGVRDCTSGLVAIRFNLTSVPTGAKINKALLNLYGLSGGDLQIHIQRAVTPWKEGEPTRPECDTAEQLSEKALRYRWNKWDVTAIVQNQVSNPSVNYGLCIRGGDIAFASRDGLSTTMPYLEITYQP